MPGRCHLKIREVIPVASVSPEALLQLVDQVHWPEKTPLADALRAAMSATSPVDDTNLGFSVMSTGNQTKSNGRWHPIPFQGIDGRINNFDVLVGTEQFIEDAGIPIPESARDTIARQREQGWASVLVGAWHHRAGSTEGGRSLIGILAVGLEDNPSFSDTVPTEPISPPEIAGHPSPSADSMCSEKTGATELLNEPLPPPAGNEVYGDLFASVRPRRGWRLTILAGLGLLAIIYMATSVMVVPLGQVIVVQRFGRIVGQCEPGPHMRPWWLLEAKTVLHPWEIDTVHIGLALQNVIMLTGDVFPPSSSSNDAHGKSAADPVRPVSASCLLQVTGRVEYSISDPIAFLSAPKNLDVLISGIAESVLTEWLGGRSMMTSLGPQRGVLAVRAQELIQQRLDHLECGIRIHRVVIDDLQPATGTGDGDVTVAMQQVATAETEKAEILAKGQSEAERLLAQAKARQVEILAIAEGEKQRMIDTVRGRVRRVQWLLDAYREDPEEVREQLFFNILLQEANLQKKIVVDPSLRPDFRMDIGSWNSTYGSSTTMPSTQRVEKEGRP